MKNAMRTLPAINCNAAIIAAANTGDGDNEPPMWMGEVGMEVNSYLLQTCQSVEKASKFGPGHDSDNRYCFKRRNIREVSIVCVDVTHVLPSTHAYYLQSFIQ